MNPYPLSDRDFGLVQLACERFIGALRESGFRVHVSRDFHRYVAVRRAHGEHHLNQAFDPDHAPLGPDDFWLLVENRLGEPVSTYCSRCLRLPRLYPAVASLELWFGRAPRLVDPRYRVLRPVPEFGGTVGHGGGFWVRPDVRGVHGFARVLPRLARALALRNNAIEHDSGMLLMSPEQRERGRHRARAAVQTYGFARAGVLVDGWFPPEAQDAVVYLCHATRHEAIQSLDSPVAIPLAA